MGVKVPGTGDTGLEGRGTGGKEWKLPWLYPLPCFPVQGARQLRGEEELGTGVE